MEPVYKTTFEVVVFSQEPLTQEHDLADLAYEMSEGDMIGAYKTVKVETITDSEELNKELVAIGNDGSFFFEEEM